MGWSLMIYSKISSISSTRLLSKNILLRLLKSIVHVNGTIAIENFQNKNFIFHGGYKLFLHISFREINLKDDFELTMCYFPVGGFLDWIPNGSSFFFFFCWFLYWLNSKSIYLFYIKYRTYYQIREWKEWKFIFVRMNLTCRYQTQNLIDEHNLLVIVINLIFLIFYFFFRTWEFGSDIGSNKIYWDQHFPMCEPEAPCFILITHTQTNYCVYGYVLNMYELRIYDK